MAWFAMNYYAGHGRITAAAADRAPLLLPRCARDIAKCAAIIGGAGED